MKLVTLSQLRFFRLAPWSTSAVLLGVLLGVASIVAVHQLSVRVVSSLDDATPTHLANVSYLLTRPGLSMRDYFGLRAAWRLGEHPAVEGLMPLVEGQVLVSNRTFNVVGLDAFSGMPAVVGLAFVPPGQVIVGTGGGFSVGEQLTAGAARVQVAVVSPALPAGTLITNTGTAQRLLGQTDEFLSRVAVQVQSPWLAVGQLADRLLPGVSAGLELPGWQLPGWQVDDMDAELPSLAFARSVLFNLGALASLALVVAWLLVYQSCVVWLRRRQVTLDRLWLMGVSNRELAGGFLSSLAVIGLVAWVLGVMVGQLLAWVLGGLAGAGYLEDGALAGWQPLDGWLLGKALASALLVCLLGGTVAFVRERGGAERARLRTGTLDSAERPVAPLVVTLLVMIALAFWGGVLTRSLIGAFTVIAAVSVILLVTIVPLLEALRRYGHQLQRGPLLGRIGLRELLWHHRDLAVAIGALALAIATSVAIALMVESFRSDFTEMLERRMVQDVFIRADGDDLAPLAASLEVLPLVSSVSRYGSTRFKVAGRVVELGFAAATRREAARYGLDRPLVLDECLISERLARDLGVSEGSTLEAAGRSLRVARVFAGFGDVRPRVLVSNDTARALGVMLKSDRLSVETDVPDTVVALIREFAEPESGRFPMASLQVEKRGALRATALEIFDRTFAMTRALTLLALIVASVSLYNAILALRLNQQQSLKLLEMMGLTRAELTAVDRWRVTGVAATAVLIALPHGVFMGWVLCRIINPRAFGWSLDLELDAGAMALPVLLAALVMLLVSFVPTPREGFEGENPA